MCIKLPHAFAVFLALFGALACSDEQPAETGDATTTETTGDGDGDTGDGDGEAGDGDGDSGDGDGDTGDGDGDGDSGDGDGDGGGICGDGMIDPGEECDDGNPIDADACTSDCLDAICGDGIVQASVEVCDDANQDETDACTNACVLATCGDGIVQAGVEMCDDANPVDTDDCVSACVAASCGDGFVWENNEVCDDANMSNTDECLDSCEPASCGDGFVQANVEECDDANMSDTDACVTGCQSAACGDGFVNMDTELCDDGNMVDDDMCGNDCLPNGEGGVLAWSAQCMGGSGCQAQCGGYDTYRTSLIQGGFSYTQVQLRGSLDMVGRTCAGPAADQICKALGNGQVLSIACNGSTWRVGTCGAGIEINANNSMCACDSPGWTVRPCINPGNSNWGGMQLNSCNAPTQTLEVRCSY